MSAILQDLRYAARTLRKNPGFTVIATLTLAIGIGATTAIFSVVDGVLLKPLPYADADRLVLVRGYHPQIGTETASYPDFVDWRSQNQSFEDLTAIAGAVYNRTDEGEAERWVGARVTHGFFSVMRTPPALGRGFVPEDDRPGAERVVVVSHRLWQARLGGDPEIVGRTLRLNDELYTVVGVAAPGFAFPDWAQLWAPLALDPATTGRRSDFLGVVGRLKPGATLEGARTEMTAIAAQLEEAYPATNTGWSTHLTRLRDDIVGDVRLALWILLSAVALVLLIGCVNVATLLLARGAAREREMAIRTAVGAKRSRLVRQLLVEATVLALLGGALGVVLAAWGVDALRALDAETIPRAAEIGVDGRVLWFALAVSACTALIFGLIPAWRRSAPDLQGSLKEAGPSTGGRGRGRGWIDRAFVVSEVALALVLLIGAGLALRSFDRLRRVDPGFVSEGVVTFRVVLPAVRYPEAGPRNEFRERLLERLRAIPGVQVAAVTTDVPLSGGANYLAFGVEGRPPLPAGEIQDAEVFVVSADYFRAMGIPLLRGRTFEAQDHMDAPRVVVINQAMARRYWPEEDPIGARVSFAPGNAPWMTVIGIVGDVRHTALGEEAYPQMYSSQAQVPQRGLTWLLRTEGDPAPLAGRVRGEVATVDPALPIYNVRTMEEIVAASVARPRFQTWLLALFAGVALALAVIGIYGVVSYATQRRLREVGIRMALGAQPRDVRRLVVVEGMIPVWIGTALGLAGAFAATRVMRALLYEIAPTDPVTFTLVPALFAGAALLASYLPARRATRADPVRALRTAE